MKSSLTTRRINSRQRGFTLVEVAVAAALTGVVGLTAFGVLRSSTVLSSQNAGINISASNAREVIDQINDKSRYSLVQPDLINTDGTLASGTTADGVTAKKYLGAPYVVKEAGGTTGDIAATTTQFTLEYQIGKTGAATQYPLIDPSVGDFILVDSVTRPELEITAVSVLSSLTVNGFTIARKLITTKTAIGEAVRPSYYRLGAALYRKEGYVFVATDATSSPRFELRHYGRVVSSTNFSLAANYKIMSNGYRRLSNKAFFTTSMSNGAETTTVNVLVNSSNRQEYVARGSTVSTFTTVPVQVQLWSVNR